MGRVLYYSRSDGHWWSVHVDPMTQDTFYRDETVQLSAWVAPVGLVEAAVRQSQPLDALWSPARGHRDNILRLRGGVGSDDEFEITDVMSAMFQGSESSSDSSSFSAQESQSEGEKPQKKGKGARKKSIARKKRSNVSAARRLKVAKAFIAREEVYPPRLLSTLQELTLPIVNKGDTVTTRAEAEVRTREWNEVTNRGVLFHGVSSTTIPKTDDSDSDSEDSDEPVEVIVVPGASKSAQRLSGRCPEPDCMFSVVWSLRMTRQLPPPSAAASSSSSEAQSASASSGPQSQPSPSKGGGPTSVDLSTWDAKWVCIKCEEHTCTSGAMASTGSSSSSSKKDDASGKSSSSSSKKRSKLHVQCVVCLIILHLIVPLCVSLQSRILSL